MDPILSPNHCMRSPSLREMRAVALEGENALVESCILLGLRKHQDPEHQHDLLSSSSSIPSPSDTFIACHGEAAPVISDSRPAREGTTRPHRQHVSVVPIANVVVGSLSAGPPVSEVV